MKINTPYTQKDILDYLENYDHETYHFFIDFEHPYFYTAGSRITLFADKDRWAIVFEKSGYSTGNDSGEIEFEYFGNCLVNLGSGIEGDLSTSNMKVEIIIKYDDLRETEEDYLKINKNTPTIKVRNTILPIEHDIRKYEALKIKPEYIDADNQIDTPSLIRYLNEQNPQLFRATDNELRQCLPADLPKLMQIDKWNHQPYFKHRIKNSPDTYTIETKGTKPSDNETYKLIADILVTKDTTKWKPTLIPNNDWRNWPNAGHM
ncbi:MAG: hypothetical protein ABUT20_08730 [Bacteroidota bacterium]